jgi:hypothetical protein
MHVTWISRYCPSKRHVFHAYQFFSTYFWQGESVCDGQKDRHARDVDRDRTLHRAVLRLAFSSWYRRSEACLLPCRSYAFSTALSVTVTCYTLICVSFFNLALFHHSNSLLLTSLIRHRYTEPALRGLVPSPGFCCCSQPRVFRSLLLFIR